jgi:hypothetical protein
MGAAYTYPAGRRALTAAGWSIATIRSNARAMEHRRIPISGIVGNQTFI